MRKLLLLLFISFFAIMVGAQNGQTGAQSEVDDAAIEEGAPERQEAPELDQTVEISKIQEYFKPFIYDNKGQKNPFAPRRLMAPLREGEVYGPFLPTQKFRLDRYQLKGLVWRTNEPVAIFQDPDKKTFRLKIKDYIGDNFGYIASIREKEVVVIQTIEANKRRYSTTKVVFLE